MNPSMALVGALANPDSMERRKLRDFPSSENQVIPYCSDLASLTPGPYACPLTSDYSSNTSNLKRNSPPSYILGECVQSCWGEASNPLQSSNKSVALKQVLLPMPSFSTSPAIVNLREDIAVIPFSSGTTGLPKGVMLTNKSILANVQQLLHPDLIILKNEGYQHIQVAALPMYHIFGMWINIMQTMDMGCKIITMKSFQPDTFIRIMNQYKPTCVPVVPPILQFLAYHPLVSPNLLDSVQVMYSGASSMGHTLPEMMFKKFSSSSVQICDGYGLTEMSPTTHSAARRKFTATSVGVPVPNTSTKLIDPETGAPVGPDIRVGELCVMGPQMMKGYFKNDKATQETIKDGWLHTGDIARIDENGLTFIVDRKKELIKVKGLQVSPSELEDLIRKFPGVDDVAVIGVPDERAGELPRAFVVPKKDAKVKEEEVKQFVATRVSAHKHLDKVIFIGAIPKSTAGKILRKDLQKLAQS